jgi:hypothetical protein
MTNKYPYYHPYLLYVSPTINYPIEDPNVPVPSIIPVIVDVDFKLLFIPSCFPRSAEQEAEIIF